MVRAAALLLAITCAAVAGSLPTDGEALFRECEFKAVCARLRGRVDERTWQRASPLLARQVLCANG